MKIEFSDWQIVEHIIVYQNPARTALPIRKRVL